MILNIAEVDDKQMEQGMRMAEELFGTAVNPDYLQVTEGNVQKLKKLNPNSILYEVERGRVLGWVVVVPTERRLAEMFVNDEITEQKLVDLTQPSDKYEAVYLCAAGIRQEFRRKGLAIRLLKEAVDRMPLAQDYQIYAWPINVEGSALSKKMESMTGKVIHLKQ